MTAIVLICLPLVCFGADGTLGTITDADLEEARRPEPPAEPAGTPGRQTLDLEGDSRQLWERVSAAFGLKLVFDDAYQPGRQRRLRLDDVDFREALDIVSTATNSFAVSVSAKLLLVANDTVQNRNQFEPTMAVIIPLPDAVSAQEAQELAQAVQQTMEIQRLIVDTEKQMVLIRDRVAKVRPAELLFEQMLGVRPEVMVEVDLLEMNEKSSLRFGMDLQTSFPLVWLGNLKNVSTAIPTGFRFVTFGGGASMFGLGLANAELFASMTRSTSHTVMRSTLRTANGQKATLHAGDRYPVITNGYFGPIEGPGQVYRPPATVNFEDLGVVVNVTPYVHGPDDVTLEVEAEYKVLAGTALNGIPVIATRDFQGVVRLRQGEWGVMSGLVRRSDTHTSSGVAGLSRIPLLGWVFRQQTTEKESADTLLVLKPRLVRLPRAEISTLPIWTGTESRPRSPM